MLCELLGEGIRYKCSNNNKKIPNPPAETLKTAILKDPLCLYLTLRCTPQSLGPTIHQAPPHFQVPNINMMTNRGLSHPEEADHLLGGTKSPVPKHLPWRRYLLDLSFPGSDATGVSSEGIWSSRLSEAKQAWVWPVHGTEASWETMVFLLEFHHGRQTGYKCNNKSMQLLFWLLLQQQC